MTIGELTRIENESIGRFVGSVPFEGMVLDYGCGRRPYQALVERAGAEYYGWDRAKFPANMSGIDVGPEWDVLASTWSAILCTQVVQFVPDVYKLLRRIRDAVKSDGLLVITWPTNWPEVNDTDIHRFTEAGMRRLLRSVGFDVERCERRAAFDLGGFELAYGYGAVCRA